MPTLGNKGTRKNSTPPLHCSVLTALRAGLRLPVQLHLPRRCSKSGVSRSGRRCAPQPRRPGSGWRLRDLQSTALPLCRLAPPWGLASRTEGSPGAGTLHWPQPGHPLSPAWDLSLGACSGVQSLGDPRPWGRKQLPALTRSAAGVHFPAQDEKEDLVSGDSGAPAPRLCALPSTSPHCPHPFCTLHRSPVTSLFSKGIHPWLLGGRDSPGQGQQWAQQFWDRDSVVSISAFASALRTSDRDRRLVPARELGRGGRGCRTGCGRGRGGGGAGIWVAWSPASRDAPWAAGERRRRRAAGRACRGFPGSKTRAATEHAQSRNPGARARRGRSERKPPAPECGKKGLKLRTCPQWPS